MRLLVTGSGGLLGSAVVGAAARRYEVYSAFSEHEPSVGTPVKLDITDREKVGQALDRAKPDAIVHAAALTDVDRCEKDRDLATQVNETATAHLAGIAEKMGAYFLYVSTDYVFDGEKGMYREDDQTGPINFYGVTKLRGEESVKAAGGESSVARASVVYGSRPASGKVNFALWVVDSLRNNKEIKVLKDQYVSPTLNTDMAGLILAAVERRATGTFHLAGRSRLSRFEFATALADSMGLDKSLIEPVSIGEMKWLAMRPKDSSLDVSKASTVLGMKPATIEEALSELGRSLDAARPR